MANYNEQMLAYIWIRQQLMNDSALTGYAPGGVWRGLAPNAVSTPFVIVQHQGGLDVITVNGLRMLVDMTFQVKAIGPGDAITTDITNSAAARIDALFGSPPGRPPSGFITVNAVNVGWLYTIYRTAPLVLDELVNGETWTSIGGMYRTQVSQIAA